MDRGETGDCLVFALGGKIRRATINQVEKIMKEKIMVCSFSVDSYFMKELSEMSGKEKYELASMHKMMGDTCADVVTLEEFEFLLNGDFADVENNWYFFVEI